MNPLAALSIDRNGLVGESIRPHGGLIYPGIHPLSAQKPQEPGPSLRLGYDLLYKPSLPFLDGQKSVNGCVELYKSPSAGLVSTAEGSGLGLNPRPGPIEKQTERGLNGAGNVLRLPWFSPYMDASMYPFLDMAYKTSLLSASPFTQQQLAYQSLCATGSNTPGDERLFFISPYSPALLASSLAPPIRMSSANLTHTVLSPLPHGQEKTLPGFGPQLPQELSAFSPGSQTHQEPQRQLEHSDHQREGSSGVKTCQPSSTKTTVSSGAHVNPSSVSQPPTSVPQSQMLSSANTDAQKHLYKSSSSSSLPAPHHFYLSSQNNHSVTSGSSNTKDSTYNTEKHSIRTKKSPGTAVPQKATKNLERKANPPEDLEEFPNGFPAKAKGHVGYLQPSHYRMGANQKQELKEGRPLPISSSTRTPDHEIISSGVSVGPCSQTLSSAVDTIPVSAEPTGLVTSIPSTTPAGQCSVNASKSKAEWPRVSTASSERNSKGETYLRKQSKPPPETKDNQSDPSLYQPSLPENKNSPHQVYRDTYLPRSLAYASRYIPYSAAETLSMQRLPVTNKGHVYPHPLLLGSSSFYQSHTALKHGLPYGLLPYQSSEKLASMSACLGLENKEQNHEFKKTHNKIRDEEQFVNQKKQDANCHKNDDETDKSTKHGSRSAPDKSLSLCRDEMVCIDLVREEVEVEVPHKQETSGGNQFKGKKSCPPETTQLIQNADQNLNSPQTLVNCPASSVPCSSQDISEEETPESPFPDIPEELTMQCARTSPWQFSRASKARPSVDEEPVTLGRICDVNKALKDVNPESSTKCEQSCPINTISLVPHGDLTNTDNETQSSVTGPKTAAVEGSDLSESPGSTTKSSDSSAPVPLLSLANPRFPIEAIRNSWVLSSASINPKDPTDSTDNPNVGRQSGTDDSLKESACESSGYTGENGNPVANGESFNAVWPNVGLRSPALGKTSCSHGKGPSDGHMFPHNKPRFPSPGGFTPGPSRLKRFTPSGDVNRLHNNPTPHVHKDLTTTRSGSEEKSLKIKDDENLEDNPQDCFRNGQSILKETNDSSGDQIREDPSVSKRIKEQTALQVGQLTASLLK